MPDMKAVFHIACNDMDSLITEDLWRYVSHIVFAPEFHSLHYMLPSSGFASIQAPTLLGYAEKEPVEFIFDTRRVDVKPYIAIDGTVVSSKHAFQSLFSVRGECVSDYPHGVLVRILEDVQQRIHAAYRFAIDSRLMEREKEIDSFRFVLGYETYMKNLKARYNSPDFVAFAPQSLLGHVWRRMQVQMW